YNVVCRRSYMREIGVRELKIQASRVLRRVRERQEEVPITYRGKVVAHVVPAEKYEQLKAGIPDFWDALLIFRSQGTSRDLANAFGSLRARTRGRRFTW